MSDNNKLTPEQQKQLQQLQQLIAMQQKMGDGQQPPHGKKKFQIPTLNSVLNSIFSWMQNSVKTVDSFIDLIVHKESKDRNDVIQTSRAPILFGMYVVILFIGVGGIWAAFAPLDSATVALGTVISDTNKKTINHQEGGIVKKIHVSVGSKVKKGEKLIEFDETRMKGDYESMLNQYRTSLANESRLLAEVNGAEKVDFPEFLLKDASVDEVAKILKTQNNLFQSRQDYKRAERDSLRQKIAQLRQQIEGVNAKQQAAKKSLSVFQDRLRATQELYKKGYAQKTALLDLENKEATAKSDIATNNSEVIRLEQEITKTDIELMNLDNKISNDNLNNLKQTQVEVATAREKYNTLRDALDRIVVRSPVDGVVNYVGVHTIGGYVQPSTALLEISPIDDKLIIEAKIAPQTIDSVTVGLVAKIRFSAFKSRTTPLFTGKVISLSPDIVVDRAVNDPKLAGGYYVARVEIDMKEFEEVAKKRGLTLHPGMQAEVQIVTGTRTLLKYLLDPLLDTMFRSFKEK